MHILYNPIKYSIAETIFSQTWSWIRVTENSYFFFQRYGSDTSMRTLKYTIFLLLLFFGKCVSDTGVVVEPWIKDTLHIKRKCSYKKMVFGHGFNYIET